MKSLLREAQMNPRVGGECLEAFFHASREDTNETKRMQATVGSRLIAQAIVDLRSLIRG